MSFDVAPLKRGAVDENWGSVGKEYVWLFTQLFFKKYTQFCQQPFKPQGGHSHHGYVLVLMKGSVMRCLESQRPRLESWFHHASLHVEFGDVTHMLLVKHNYFLTSQDSGETRGRGEVFGEGLALGLL